LVDQEEIHNQCLSNDPKKRIYALEQIQIFVSSIRDKQQAWNDLHRLTNDENCVVKCWAAKALGSAFSQVPDKQQAWNELIRLTNDEDSYVRSRAAEALGSLFSQASDKQQAWNELIRLTNDEDSDVRYIAAEALGSAFSQVPDKQQAWNDLRRLTNDKDCVVRFWAAKALGSLFSQASDKQQAWNELIRLTNDEDSNVSSRAASVLCSAFSQVPDKQQTWNVLIRLTNDEDIIVRTSSNYSLGRVSIYMASKAETDEDYKKELEKAIEFFETAAKEASYFNPAQFCLPFYRSFYTIIFKKQDSKEEVNKYLEEAKAAIKGSDSKKQLFEAVENLSEALKEVQKLGNLDLPEMKCELNFYRRYCDRAEELMEETEEMAPFAIKIMRKGLPIFGIKLKGILEDIQKKTKVIREQTKGTQFEELGNELNQGSQFISEIRDPVGLEKKVNIMQNTLKIICSKLPESQKGETCELLKIMFEEPLIEDKISILDIILSKFSYQLDMMNYLNRFEEKLDHLDNIRFDIFKIKLNYHNVISNLDAMAKELEKLNDIESSKAFSIERLNSNQSEKLNNLNNEIQKRLSEIGILIDDFPKNNDTRNILGILNELKQSKLEKLLQTPASVTGLIGFLIQVVQLIQPYVH
jgi:HEAT repeat protein